MSEVQVTVWWYVTMPSDSSCLNYCISTWTDIKPAHETILDVSYPQASHHAKPPMSRCSGARPGTRKHEGGTIGTHVPARKVAFWYLLELRNC